MNELFRFAPVVVIRRSPTQFLSRFFRLKWAEVFYNKRKTMMIVARTSEEPEKTAESFVTFTTNKQINHTHIRPFEIVYHFMMRLLLFYSLVLSNDKHFHSK